MSRRYLADCYYVLKLETNACKSYFLQIKEPADTRLFLDGQPGAGKTTFVKRICYLWGQRLHGTPAIQMVPTIQEYTVILPIILKFINNENTLMDILSSQMQFLSIFEICAVIKHIEKNPKDTLLLLDGYDEYNGQSYIENVILKKENEDVHCMATARPHAVEQIKRHSSQAVQQHVRLCSFSDDQVKQYIKQFCQSYGLPEGTGEELMETLQKRPDLLEVVKIPIRTEMICVVWAVDGKLGDTLADLYERFILHLITHWDKKLPTSSRYAKLSDEEIWQVNQPFFFKVGELANKWTKHSNLCSMYSDKEIEDVLEGDHTKLIDIGLLTKSYPSYSPKASKWSFPHLTFQEYFIAYLLGNDTDGEYTNSFITKCKSYHYRVLSKYELVFTFLTSTYPEKANKIITRLLQEETDKVGSEELFDMVCEQFQNVLVSQAMDIPLPVHLNLESHKLNNNILNVLDQSRNESNLRHLSLDKPIQFKKFLDIVSIEELNVTTRNEKELNLVNEKIKHLSYLTSLSIDSTVRFCVPGQEDTLKNIQEQKLNYLSITGPGALEDVARNISRFTNLDTLRVDESSNTNDKTNGQKILSALKANKFLKQVNFSVMDLDDIIIKEDVAIKVKVHVKKLKPGTLKITSDMQTRDSTLALHTLDLGHNNLENEGRPLGEFMAKVSGLRVLGLADCKLKPTMIQEMVDAMTKVQLPCKLQTLNMGQYEKCNRNKLNSAGSALGKLLRLMPELQILDLEDCNLKSNDFDAMAYELSEVSTKLQTLNLGGNELGEANKGGSQFLQHMLELKALKAGGYNSDDPIPAICGAVDTGTLTRMSILDVSDSSVDSKNMAKLSEHLHFMKFLNVLNLKGLDGINLEDYNPIYKNVPPSLTHLNVNSDQTITKETPYDILGSKRRFNKLLRLNINLTESDLGLLQELLEEINPNIQVYNNANENLWRTYVLNEMNS